MIHLEKELNQKPKYLKSLPFTQKFYITLLTKFKDRSIPHILFIWRLEGAMLNSNAGFMMIQSHCSESPHGESEVNDT